MTPNISEFSYGYALTEELIQSHGTIVTAAPYFPTLRAEGQLGYDIRLDRPGFPLFLQFKLSHNMIRNSALEIHRHGLFRRDTKFYRMYLRKPPSDQHQLLMNLEASGNEVYYVAPAFGEPDELDDAYLNHHVRNRSVFIRPSWVGPLPDNREHWVSFLISGPRFLLSEEPQPLKDDIEFAAFASDIKEALSRTEESLGGRLERLPDEITSMLKEYTPPWHDAFEARGRVWASRMQRAREQLGRRLASIERHRKEMKPLQLASYLSRTFFDCELFLAGTVAS